MSILLWLLALGAAVRLTMLLTWDDFPPAAWFRLKVATTFGTESAAYQLVTCPWCCSFWIGLAVFSAAIASGGAAWFVLVASALIGSGVAGVTVTLLDRE